MPKTTDELLKDLIQSELTSYNARIKSFLISPDSQHKNLYSYLEEKITEFDSQEDDTHHAVDEAPNIEKVIYRWYKSGLHEYADFQKFYCKRLAQFLTLEAWRKTLLEGENSESKTHVALKSDPLSVVMANQIHIINFQADNTAKLCFALEYSKFGLFHCNRESLDHIRFKQDKFENALLTFGDKKDSLEQEISVINDPIAKVISDEPEFILATAYIEQQRLAEEAKSTKSELVPRRPAAFGNLLNALRKDPEQVEQKKVEEEESSTKPGLLPPGRPAGFGNLLSALRKDPEQVEQKKVEEEESSTKPGLLPPGRPPAFSNLLSSLRTNPEQVEQKKVEEEEEAKPEEKTTRPAMPKGLFAALNNPNSDSKASFNIKALRGEDKSVQDRAEGKSEMKPLSASNTSHVVEQTIVISKPLTKVEIEANTVLCLAYLADRFFGIITIESNVEKAYTKSLFQDFCDFIIQNYQETFPLIARFATIIKFTNDYDLYHLTEHPFSILPLPIEYNSKRPNKKSTDIEILELSTKHYSDATRLFYTVLFENFSRLPDKVSDGIASFLYSQITTLRKGVAEKKTNLCRIYTNTETDKIISGIPALDVIIILVTQKAKNKHPKSPSEFNVALHNAQTTTGAALKDQFYLNIIREALQWLKQDKIKAPQILKDLFEIIACQNLFKISKDNIFLTLMGNSNIDASDDEIDEDELFIKEAKQLQKFLTVNNLLLFKTDKEASISHREDISGEEMLEKHTSMIKDALIALKNTVERTISSSRIICESIERNESIAGYSIDTSSSIQSEIRKPIEELLKAPRPFRIIGEELDEQQLDNYIRIQEQLLKLTKTLEDKQGLIKLYQERCKEITRLSICTKIAEKCHATIEEQSNFDLLDKALKRHTCKISSDEEYKALIGNLEKFIEELNQAQDEKKAKRITQSNLDRINTDLTDTIIAFLSGVNAADLNAEAIKKSQALEKEKFALEQKLKEAEQKAANSSGTTSHTNDRAQILARQNAELQEKLNQLQERARIKELADEEARRLTEENEQLKLILSQFQRSNIAAISTEDSSFSSEEMFLPPFPPSESPIKRTEARTPLKTPSSKKVLSGNPLQSPLAKTLATTPIQTPKLVEALSENKILRSEIGKYIPQEQEIEESKTNCDDEFTEAIASLNSFQRPRTISRDSTSSTVSNFSARLETEAGTSNHKARLMDKLAADPRLCKLFAKIIFYAHPNRSSLSGHYFDNLTKNECLTNGKLRHNNIAGALTQPEKSLIKTLGYELDELNRMGYRSDFAEQNAVSIFLNKLSLEIKEDISTYVGIINDSTNFSNSLSFSRSASTASFNSIT